MIIVALLFMPLLQADPPDVDFEFKVSRAIDKGIAHLKDKRITFSKREPGKHVICDGNELLLLTYLHAGMSPDDPHFQELLGEMLEDKLEWTYRVALQAMVLEELDRSAYQWRIQQCAQFLADNIGPRGTTAYGHASEYAEATPRTRNVATSTRRGRGKAKPRPPAVIPVRQRRVGADEYDHSNMQYLVLGLRACHDAGIRFEPALLRKVDQWFRGAQVRNAEAKKTPLILSGPAGGPRRGTCSMPASPAGWSYVQGRGSYGSMTAGAVGALCIMDFLQGRDWKADQDVLDGLQWMNAHFSVAINPERHAVYKDGDRKNLHYYLYALERVGMLFGTEVIGDHRWYREGADCLMAEQHIDGSWEGRPVETCFAILFLKRATHALPVASGNHISR